ncbi:MAG: BamA/TamA family outer membrane protein [Candidatus Omnitrophica bacterium]|nr:BamA/TamA family outer membrane protein [Candidatus Omnitrophota bacterium]
MTKNRRVTMFTFLLIFSTSYAFAQEAGTTGKVESSERQIEKEKELRLRIEKEKTTVPIEEEKPAQVAPVPAAAEKALVTTINVSGVTLFSESEIFAITSSFLNRELTLKEMQRVADLITDLYRTNGYVTSHAYLPPQKIEGGIMEIRVIEGQTGRIEIKGNRFFRSAQLKRSLGMNTGEFFNYNVLRRNLGRINEHPDRNAKAVLAPGKDPGTTDIILEVKDKLPLHAQVGWDNYGSRYLRKNHYTTGLTHNNLLGFDDILSVQYQVADAEDYRLGSLRYLFPVDPRLKVGVFGSFSHLALGKEYREVMARGKSRMYSLFSMYDLVAEDNLGVVFNLGFDYKDSFNFQLADEESRDRLRVVKAGFDVDVSDDFAGSGRSIISQEIDCGISRIMGGLRAVDPHASRSGAGGKFVKNTFNILRLQKTPLESTLLWKNQLQISPYILTATEQFQLGGIANNRGYPSAEYVGDEGFATSLELNLPFYGLSREIKLPFDNVKLYDAMKWVIFYDWGFTQLRQPQAGEKKNSTLRSFGCGFRFNLPQNFYLRADFGWPLAKTPSDGNHFHPWLSISKEF